ncbi:hypothetical protein Q6346_07390 [Isoptericola sp. b490]|nr:hypothetical protein [Isoptericola sp. b490]MDO8121136.1 hypothetical protein [Isoptericola sp. b490]
MAGVGVQYYTRTERGRQTRGSPQVLEAVARAGPCRAQHGQLLDPASSATGQGPVSLPFHQGEGRRGSANRPTRTAAVGGEGPGPAAGGRSR